MKPTKQQRLDGLASKVAAVADRLRGEPLWRVGNEPIAMMSPSAVDAAIRHLSAALRTAGYNAKGVAEPDPPRVALQHPGGGVMGVSVGGGREMKMLRVKNRAGAIVGGISPTCVVGVGPSERGAGIHVEGMPTALLVREPVADVCIAIDAALRGEEREVTEAGDD